jgi:hypothetical protein
MYESIILDQNSKYLVKGNFVLKFKIPGGWVTQLTRPLTPLFCSKIPRIRGKVKNMGNPVKGNFGSKLKIPGRG